MIKTGITVNIDNSKKDIYLDLSCYSAPGIPNLNILHMCEEDGYNIRGYHLMDIDNSGIDLIGYLGGYNWDDDEPDVSYEDMGIDINTDDDGKLCIEGVDLCL